MSDEDPYRIPFNRPAALGREMEYVADALARGQISGGGVYTRRCEALLEELLEGTVKVLLTTSCTHALEMCGLLLDLDEGSEVVLPSFTFVSSANAIALRGARPVLADIRQDTLNLDEERLGDLVSERTAAIEVVHYAGVACEMDSIMETAGRHGVPVIEDNAHGFLGQYRGTHLGRFGALATLSFHETKNFTCGEGGALIINDPALIERAEILREKGTNRKAFFRGQVDKYTWVDLGSSFIPSDLLAGFLLGQLELREEIQARRRRIYDRYNAALDGWARAHGVRLPFVPEHCESAHHLFHLVLPTQDARDGLINHLRERGILSVFHYVPLHLSRMGRSLGYKAGDLPVSERVSERLVRLPFFNDLTLDDQERVVAAVEGFSV